jgi:hypothetical protein
MVPVGWVILVRRERNERLSARAKPESAQDRAQDRAQAQDRAPQPADPGSTAVASP